MKGYGHLGHGAPFSSSSNLSPLAPPFTVDSSFPRPQPNQFEPTLLEPVFANGTPYYVARPSHGNHDWHQKDSPTDFVPHLFSNSNSSSSPVPSLSPGTYGYGVSVQAIYHPHYSSASIQESSTSLTANECGNLLPSSGYLPTTPVGAFWNGKSSGEQWKGKDGNLNAPQSYEQWKGKDVNLDAPQSYERWKGKDVNLGAPPSYATLVNQGISAADGLPACEEPSNVWVGNSVDSLAGKGYVGSQCTNLPPRKLSSASEENSRDTPFDMLRTSVLNPVSLQEMPYHRAPSPDYIMEPWSQLNPSIASYGGYYTGFDSYKADPLCLYPTSSNSSGDQIFGTPLNNSHSATLLNRTVSANMTPIERPRDACGRKEVSASYSPSSTGCIEVNAEIYEGYGDKSSIYDGVNENNRACLDPSTLKNIVSLQRNTLSSVDPLKNLFKAKNKGQVTDFDLPGTLVTAKTGASESFECSSDVLEQAYPGVDSPCWKGASDSRYSLFGEAEAETAYTPAKLSEGCNSFSVQGTENHPVNSNKALDFSSLEVQNFEKCFGEVDSASFSRQSEYNCQTVPKVGSDHLQPSNENVIKRTLPNNADGGFDGEPSQTIKFSYNDGNAASRQNICQVNIADLGIGIKDSAHVGTDWVPYHVSDHYSGSISRGNVPVDTNLTEPLLGRVNNFTGCQLSRENVQTAITSMHNLSELLLSYCSIDENALKEQDHVLIQQVVQNLDTCVLRDGTVRSVPKTHSFLSEMANCSGETTNIHKGTVASKYTEVKDVQNRRSIQNASEGKKNPTMFSMKEQLAFLGGDSDSELDEMTEGLKETLEKSFHDEEEPDQQGLLYKNLWLEAEAALFAGKFKARVARMKIKMEKRMEQIAKEEHTDVEELPSSKVASEDDSGTSVEPKSKENVDSHVEKLPSLRVTLDLNSDILVESGSKESVDSEGPRVWMQDPEQSSTASHVEDVDTSVMARFRILKSRINNTIPVNIERQPHDSTDGRSHAGIQVNFSNPSKGNEDVATIKPQQQQNGIPPGFAERRNPWPFIKNNSEVNLVANMDHYSVDYGKDKAGGVSGQQYLEFGAMQSATSNNILADRLSTGGESGSPSSDWEHVLKEATWPA